jgi:hypothetical protein
MPGQVPGGMQRCLELGDPRPGGIQVPVGQGPRRCLPLAGGLLALGDRVGGLRGDQRVRLLPDSASALDSLPGVTGLPGVLGGFPFAVLGGTLGPQRFPGPCTGLRGWARRRR